MLSSVNYSNSAPCFGGSIHKMSKKAVEKFEKKFPWGDEKKISEYVDKNRDEIKNYAATRIMNGDKKAWQLLLECLKEQMKTMPPKEAQELEARAKKISKLLDETV